MLQSFRMALQGVYFGDAWLTHENIVMITKKVDPCVNVSYSNRVDDPEHYNFCTVPDGGYDAVLFAAVALLVATAASVKMSALNVLLVGEARHACMIRCVPTYRSTAANEARTLVACLWPTQVLRAKSLHTAIIWAGLGMPSRCGWACNRPRHSSMCSSRLCYWIQLSESTSSCLKRCGFLADDDRRNM